MKNLLDTPTHATEQMAKPEKIVLPEDARIIYDAIRKAGAQGVDGELLLAELTQHGLVDIPGGFDEVPYRISEWDETPEYDIDYVPRYDRLSVYDSDDLTHAYDLLLAKGLIRYDEQVKKWFTATRDKTWEKPLDAFLEVRLLKITVEEAKKQIRRYQTEAPQAEAAVIGSIDIFSSFAAKKLERKYQHENLTLPNGLAVQLSALFEEENEAQSATIELEARSEATDAPILLAVEAPEGTLRALLQLEMGQRLKLPVAELGFDPIETGITFRAIEAS